MSNSLPDPPIDDTKKYLNGVEVKDGDINPINIAGLPQNNSYTREMIPKRIKKNIVNHDINLGVDNLSKPSHNVVKPTKPSTDKNEIRNRLLKIGSMSAISSQTSESSIVNTEVPAEVPKVSDQKSHPQDEDTENPLLDMRPKKNKKNKKKPKKVYINANTEEKSQDSHYPNYDNMTEEERIIHRNSFRLKFDVLRRWHPGLSIENGIENNNSLYVVHKVYELYLAHIYREINSNFYRGILLISWIALELFGTHALGLDVSGYTKQQINLLWAYEPLIAEFSTVNFNVIVETWTPFQKLLGLVLGTFVFMIVIRLILSYIQKKTGHNIEGLSSTIMDFISSMVFSKPQTNNAPHILISNNFNPGQNVNEGVSLGKIHNLPVPSASSINMDSQINMASGAINLINTLTGKSSAQSAPLNTAAQGRSNPVRFNGPSFTS